MRKITLFAILALSIGYCATLGGRAKSRAETICSAVESNASFSVAESVVGKANIPVRAHPTFLDEYAVKVPPDHIMIVFPAGISERWACVVKFAHGRVESKEVVMLSD